MKMKQSHLRFDISFVLVASVCVVVLILLVRTILNTPFARSFMSSFSFSEGFAGTALINSTTECPVGTQFYMYDGKPFCCSGKVDSSATTVQKSCRPLGNRDEQFTFCTLGPASASSSASSSSSIKNCLELREGIMKAKGDKVCPAGMSYVESVSGQAKCCAGPANAGWTDCAVPTASFCPVTADANADIFKNPNSCQFLKARSEAPACPAGFAPFTTSGAGSLPNDITLFGCSDSNQNCYASSTLATLRSRGYDVSGLTDCSSTGV